MAIHSKQKILFITLRTFSMTGGIENVCKNISYHFYQEHQRGKLTCQMISLYDDLPSEKYIDPLFFKGYKGKNIAAFISSIQQGLKQDLVILSHINLAPIGLMIKLLSPKTKVVLWTHGIEVWRPINWVKKKLLNTVDQIIAVSNYTAQSLNAWHKVAKEKVKVIPNSLGPFYVFPELKDEKQNILEKYGLENNWPIFMAVCRIRNSEKAKNYDLVIKTLAQLKMDGQNSYYFLCGKYENIEFERLKKLAQELDFENELILPGYLVEEEIIEIQQAANAFVLPSQKEGFGLVFIEAQAAGLRVIVGNQDGSLDALKNSIGGIAVNPDKKNELKDALIKFTESISLTEKKNVQNKCEGIYNYMVFSENLNIFLKELLD